MLYETPPSPPIKGDGCQIAKRTSLIFAGCNKAPVFPLSSCGKGLGCDNSTLSPVSGGSLCTARPLRRRKAMLYETPPSPPIKGDGCQIAKRTSLIFAGCNKAPVSPLSPCGRGLGRGVLHGGLASVIFDLIEYLSLRQRWHNSRPPPSHPKATNDRRFKPRNRM